MYNYFAPNKVKPSGWLRRQLELQLAGLAGNLDKMWPDVRNSAWIGGDREGWERVPYWLDGFIPLGFLLENEDAIARAKKYIDAILDRQQADGWICPCSEEEREKYDTWSHFLIGKVLAQYCEFTHDERAEKGLYDSMVCLYSLMKEGKIHLIEWGKYRHFECMIPLQYLYDKYPEKWILELADLLTGEGINYLEYTKKWEKPLNHWVLYTHIVNLCMMLKTEAVTNNLFGKAPKKFAENNWKLLEKYNGTAVGTFTGDECLSGIGNNRGTELCSVAELMYTCEVLYSITKNPIWAERLEKLAFNALPATISDDMWTHQYDQMVNQIACILFPGRSHFRTNNQAAHRFGLEPHFGCCTANFGQAWPKLVTSMFVKEKDGIRITSMLPAILHEKINGVDVKLTCDTEYPFRRSGKYIIEASAPVDFTLYLRVPSFADKCIVDGKEQADKEIKIRRTWSGRTELNIEFFYAPHYVNRPFKLNTVEYGPLVFSLPIETEYKMFEYERNGVERKFPYCDYELHPRSQWRYGFADDSFEVVEKDGDEIPFSSKAPRVVLRTKLARVNWDYEDGFNTVAAKVPRSRKAISAPEEFELYPYGAAKLRMTEMPKVK